jgi:hypothetical protein
MQIDADIEHKASARDHANRLKQHPKSEFSSQPDEINAHRTDTDPLELTLFQQFQSMTISENKLCEKNYVSKACDALFNPYYE